MAPAHLFGLSWWTGAYLPGLQAPALPAVYPRYNHHTSLGGLHLEVDVDKETDALARHNGGVDGVEGLFCQALLMGFRGIICVTLEVAWRPNHHREKDTPRGPGHQRYTPKGTSRPRSCCPGLSHLVHSPRVAEEALHRPGRQPQAQVDRVYSLGPTQQLSTNILQLQEPGPCTILTHIIQPEKK